MAEYTCVYFTDDRDHFLHVRKMDEAIDHIYGDLYFLS